MHRNFVISLSAVALSLSLGGCATRVLKAPESVKGSQELKVEGYSSGFKSFKEGELKIGSYAVTNIDRDWDKGSGVSAGGGMFTKDKKKKAYRFDVKSQARTLHAECTEEAVTKGIAGFSKSNVTFGCVFTEGETAQGKVNVVNGEGALQIGEGITYNVTTLHEAEGGSTASTALGYQFTGPQGAGVVDVTGTGRAWLPASAAEEESLGLAASYASMLLYRPTE